MKSLPPISWILAAGMALLVASFAMPLLLPVRGAWTNEKAEAYNLARAKLHSFSQELSQSRDAQQRVQMEQAVAEARFHIKQQEQALEQAQHRADVPTWVLRMLGALAIVAGLAMYAREKNQSK
jgi:hypothetical protein